tara:strand:- start:32 stop:301 length:270 start_codon:yes stop_codon:yes gene_type:complete
MKKAVIFLVAVAIFSLNSCNKCAECHAAADINGTEYELMELGEYCDDNLTSVEANGYSLTDTVYVTADGDSLPNAVYPQTVEVHCGEDH